MLLHADPSFRMNSLKRLMMCMSFAKPRIAPAPLMPRLGIVLGPRGTGVRRRPVDDKERSAHCYLFDNQSSAEMTMLIRSEVAIGM